jgi:serine phosphatase RsbU (regulator of sigma subunit)
MTTTSQVEEDLQAQLELARQVQLRLLPERSCCLSDWEVAFSYESAGFVSGDYVDLIPAGAHAFYFALGDVSGKGVAASTNRLRSILYAVWRLLAHVKTAIHGTWKDEGKI